MRQIGPSCGIAALTMSIAYLLPNTSSSTTSKNDIRNSSIYINYSSQLMKIAIQESYSTDGELFDINNVVSLVTSLDSQLMLGIKAVAQPIEDILSKEYIINNYTLLDLNDNSMEVNDVSTMVIIPYDRDPMGNGPFLKNGNNAHYAVIIGYINIINTDVNDSNREEIYLIVLQGNIYLIYLI